MDGDVLAAVAERGVGGIQRALVGGVDDAGAQAGFAQIGLAKAVADHKGAVAAKHMAVEMQDDGGVVGRGNGQQGRRGHGGFRVIQAKRQ
jgi:hypothetical protein